jgi:hypothetical protein
MSGNQSFEVIQSANRGAMKTNEINIDIGEVGKNVTRLEQTDSEEKRT